MRAGSDMKQAEFSVLHGLYTLTGCGVAIIAIMPIMVVGGLSGVFCVKWSFYHAIKVK